jgi:hypothetical protein
VIDDPVLLGLLAQFLSRDEVLELYQYILDHAGRELEWRVEFEAAFPQHASALPPMRDYSEELEWCRRQLAKQLSEQPPAPKLTDEIPF